MFLGCYFRHRYHRSRRRRRRRHRHCCLEIIIDEYILFCFVLFHLVSNSDDDYDEICVFGKNSKKKNKTKQNKKFKDKNILS